MKFIKYFLLAVLSMAFILMVGLIANVRQFISEPLDMQADQIEFTIPKGAHILDVAEALDRQGVGMTIDLFRIYARYTGADHHLKAGTYLIKRGDTPKTLLEKFTKGEFVHHKFTIVEGLTTQQILQELAKRNDIKHTDLQSLKKDLTPECQVHLEGCFLPDTYVFVPYTTDAKILLHAHQALERYIQQQWATRDPDVPLKNPYEALILASIVEKESGRQTDRAKIAGVFVNRLKAHMRLQTDPTVIYGMGDRYQGKIHKVDLQTDNPYNTYTRAGLPPTPIANPSKASIDAVLHPDKNNFYYFVSRGDGTTEFSPNLRQHQKNVNQFILKKGRP